MVNTTLRLTSVAVPWRRFGHRPSPNLLNTQSQPPLSLSCAAVSTKWSEFAERVSGEWDGFGADFTGDEGKPIHLPEAVVPEAFREWEVEVFDWQTQCPTLASSSPFILSYKTIRLLPTVGCEADAATRHSVHPRSASSASAFAYHPSGSYVAVWPIGPHLEVEHSLVNPVDRESRVRIVQVVEAGGSLIRVQVFREQWYGPFRDGEQLGGCAIKDSAFASTAPLDASLVVGAWEGSSSVAHFATNSSIQELADGGIQRSLRDERGLILLPKQIWCSVQAGQGGETCCEVGWLYNQRSAVTSRCAFNADDAKLKEISVAQETATSEAA